jgi:mono/diheme cytochrome c family protein
LKLWKVVTRTLFFLLGLMLAPAVVLVAFSLGLWPWHAISKPPGWENALATRSLQVALRREAAKVHSPLDPSEETLLAGMRIYRINCAGCHGDFGQVSTWGANAFYPRVPQFPDAPPRLRAEEMFLIVRNGVRYSGMGAWKDLMSEEDTWRVVLFLGNLSSLPPAVRSTWEGEKR